MLTMLIAPITGIIVSTSVGVAIDSAVRMIVPIGIKTLPAFGIKLGTAIAGGVIGVKVASIVEKNISEVIETVTHKEAEEVAAQEDN